MLIANCLTKLGNQEIFIVFKIVNQNDELKTSHNILKNTQQTFVILAMPTFNIFSSTHQALRSHLGPFQFESAHQAHWAD